jgi:hypothetical protein
MRKIKENPLDMLKNLMKIRTVILLTFLAFVLCVGIVTTPPITNADEIKGIELLAMARAVHGGAEYIGLKTLSATAEGYMNVAPFTGVALGPMTTTAGVVELEVAVTDWQNTEMQRRLDIIPKGAFPGKTYLTYSGVAGGGMFMNNPFRMSDTSLPRHWAMMGFSTLNRALDGQLTTVRQSDDTVNGINCYVVEVKFTPADTIRFWISKRDFLIYKVVTRYNSKVLIEEFRSDYRKTNCMLMLPYKIETRQNGQRLADLKISEYKIGVDVPAGSFTLEGR